MTASPAAAPAVRACIGLGANLGDPERAVRDALLALAALPESRLLASSRLYRTPAWGRIDQPDYINAAALLETRLAAEALLVHLLDIERQAGRVRDGVRWGPRLLDLDVLLYGDQSIDTHGLRVPHPHLHARAFALVPLAEIAAEAPFPGHGSVGEALRRIDLQGVEAIGDA